jgi:hypothetical protein
VLPQPHQRKTPPSQQLHLLETLRKTVPKRLYFFPTQLERILLLFLPFYLNPFERLIAVFLASGEALGWELVGCIFVFVPGEYFDGFEAGGVVEGLFLEGVLDVGLLGLPLLLARQLQVLETLRNVFLQGRLLEPRTLRLVRLPEAIVLPTVRGLYFLQG